VTISALPVAVLEISAVATGRDVSESSEPVYGGYANARGDVILFGKDLAYRVNFKKQTLQERPQLNPGAQARYDATGGGEEFEWGRKTFRRLSDEQIVEICSSGLFKLTSKYYGSY
jgi:hypothetical protein